MPNNHVNLVFHGVFAFILNKKNIQICCPYFAPHEYRFGCWKDLSPLGKGTYSLTGLQGIKRCHPKGDFDPNLSPTVKGFPLVDSTYLFCGLVLDSYPISVHHFRPYKKPSGVRRFPFGGVHGPKVNPSALAGPIALTYSAKSFDNVKLVYGGKPVYFEPKPEPSPHESILNLHFFAEGENDLPPVKDPDWPYQVGAHYKEAWARLSGLICALDLRLDQIWPFVGGSTEVPPYDTGVPGLPGSQLLDLDEIYQLSLLKDPTSKDVKDALGGHTDCDKAHLIVDNRS